MLILLTLSTLLAVVPQQVSQHSIVTKEGLSLPLRYYTPIAAGAPTIIVVHEWGGSMERWTEIAERLQGLGFGVVVFNLRGHGGTTTAYYYFTDEMIASLRDDVALAISFARERGSRTIFLLGAGLGANLAISVAAEDGRISKVVAISPGLSYRGIGILEPLKSLNPERLFLIASLEDVYSAYSIREIVKQFTEEPENRLLNNAGHGIWILKRQEGMLDTIAAWLGRAP